MTKEEYEQTQQQEQAQESQDNKQLPEMRTSFNKVMSDTLSPLYAGSSINAFEWVEVYVDPMVWASFNEEQQKAIIERVARVYSGMLGARDIQSFNSDMLRIYFKDNNTKETLGEWSGISGASV